MWQRFKAWLKRWVVREQPRIVRIDPKCIGYTCTTQDVEICFSQAGVTISMSRRELRRFITQLAIMVTESTPLDEHIQLNTPFSEN
jgi:hypothetical protein